MKSETELNQKMDMPRLSAHEMAALMLLGYAPVEVGGENPDLAALSEAGLAERNDSETGPQQFLITRKGKEMLGMLSAMIVQEFSSAYVNDERMELYHV
jgi:hypothetical protein